MERPASSPSCSRGRPAPVAGAEQFEPRRSSSAAARRDRRRASADRRTSSPSGGRDGANWHDEAAEVNAELRSLHDRRTNIPRRSLELRDRLCAELSSTQEELPFAGELIQVRADQSDWEGAAERVLRGFGLSLLVPTSTTQRCPTGSMPTISAAGSSTTGCPTPGRGRSRRRRAARCTRKLEIKDVDRSSTGSTRELRRRADYVCVESMAEFRRERRAVTRAGQIKSDQRHEKNDRAPDRRPAPYVLGWTNEAEDRRAAHAGRPVCSSSRTRLTEQRAG